MVVCNGSYSFSTRKYNIIIKFSCIRSKMSSLSNIENLIAQFKEEDRHWEKETEKHFENQRDKYKEMFERIKGIKDKSEKSIDDITKGLNKLVDNQHTIEKALKQTDNLDGLPISPEQQENAIDLINKITKFMNKTDVITSSKSISPEQIQEDVASYTANVAEELKDYKTDLRQVNALKSQTKLLHYLTADSTEKPDSQKILYTITEHE